jgi:hypothetical protein
VGKPRRKRGVGIAPDTSWMHREGCVVISHPTPRAECVPCAKCANPTDVYGRCWVCVDWVCGCGRLTGSVLISTCNQCARGKE